MRKKLMEIMLLVKPKVKTNRTYFHCFKEFGTNKCWQIWTDSALKLLCGSIRRSKPVECSRAELHYFPHPCIIKMDNIPVC